ncbi:hypothetical protein GKE82_25385 [Conexibacter sp. W3-3-2]|uniref:flagellar basal body-associated FliL family protein n=1 Tax=Conexibacter sp. W3-3-2 TaxID=2675227 RepID=UPI0012B8C32A|nr:flagellar basal body-associated FliL family protein [Conexibacter sp. W3-3-2]MTD47541.1 hypothetical protein [Conexibacter sp. W3-3-2]
MKKLLLLVAVLLIAAGAVYKLTSSTPNETAAAPRIEGEVYVLPREFVVTLGGARYARVGVGLVLAHGFSSAPHAPAEGAPAELPEGFGPLEQEAAVRAIVTEVLTGRQAGQLTSRTGRRRVKERIRRLIVSRTDVEVDEVLFTDLVVQ